MSEQQIDIIARSVTADDYADNPRQGIFNFILPMSSWSSGGMTPEAPPYWSRARDQALRRTILHEDFWAGAIGIAITKTSSKAWEVDSEINLRSRRLQEILLNTNWTNFISMHLRDYLTTDNGAFVEIVRASSSPVSRIMGIVHLDSLRCDRTGDPDIPVIYTDRKGREHELESHQVFWMADMPDPSEMLYGVGYCAASRAWRSIYKLHVMDRYVGEKVSGRRPLAIHFVNSVGPKMLENARQAAEEDAARQGILSYMGAIVIPLLDASTSPQVSTIPLAELPDRFNRKEEFDIALLSYADNIGLDPQDLQPLTGAPLGTGAQSVVLDEKAKGKGLASWLQGFTHQVNEYLADDLTTFAFIETDYRDQERKAAISKARADASMVRITAGITTAPQELQILVDLDEIPQEFLPQDVTGDTLSDTEKPEKEAEAGMVDEIGEMPEPEGTPETMTKAPPEGHEFYGNQWTGGSGGGGGGGGSSSARDYLSSDSARTLPRDMKNPDGGPGKSIQYHGTPQKGINELSGNEVYLQEDPEEAKGYASGKHMMQDSKGGEILAVRRSPGETLNLNPELERRMLEGDDPDSVINEYLSPARESGYRYIYIEHPTFSGKNNYQKVVISLYPKEDLKIVKRYSNKEVNIKGIDDELMREIDELRDESIELFKDARKKDKK